MDLQNYLTATALEQGALLVGYTKIRKVQPVMILSFPFSDKWILNHPFYITRRFNEELISSWKLQNKICNLLRGEGYRAELKTALSVFGDFRPLAIAAGLGEWGKNGLVVNKKYGSHLLFAAVFTNAPFESLEPMPYSSANKICLDCNQCIRACPSKAFSGGSFSFRHCFPFAIRGCSECVHACRGQVALTSKKY